MKFYLKIIQTLNRFGNKFLRGEINKMKTKQYIFKISVFASALNEKKEPIMNLRQEKWTLIKETPKRYIIKHGEGIDYCR